MRTKTPHFVRDETTIAQHHTARLSTCKHSLAEASDFRDLTEGDDIGLSDFSGMEAAMMRRGIRFRMSTRVAIIVWVLIVVGAVGTDIILVTEHDWSAALLELSILGAGLLGLAMVIFAFNHFLFRDRDPRGPKR